MKTVFVLLIWIGDPPELVIIQKHLESEAQCMAALRAAAEIKVRPAVAYCAWPAVRS